MDRKTLLGSTENLQDYPLLPLSPEVFVPPELTHGESYHVFFSFSSTDYQWTHSLIQQLEARGLRVCFHERDFTPGRTILENMSESIQQSQKVLLVLSPDFVRSHWCLLEANMSMFRDCLERKPIVPVLLQPDVSIPLRLSHLTYLEASHPHFTNQLLKVLCTPNQQLQGSTVVPYQPPTIYNGKTLQPLIAVNKEGLDKYDCGVWSDTEVPEELRLIIKDTERFREAIKIINSVSEKKARFHLVRIRALFDISAALVSLSGLALILCGVPFLHHGTHDIPYIARLVLIVFLIGVVVWTIRWLILVRKNEAKRIVRELQKALAQANTLLFEENVLMGSQSNSKIYLVYVSLDGCRRELTELSPEQDQAEDTFHKALLEFSSDYTCCLAKKHFPIHPPSDAGHLERRVCFCQYVSHRVTKEQQFYTE